NGAISSNLAQLDRNFDVPMLVNASSATDILTDGSRVTLDCVNGTVIEGSVEPLDRPEPAQRQPLDRPQLTATDLYTLSEQVEHADGTVSIGQGHVRGATWSINAENPQKRIHSEFRDDFQGGAVLVDSFADILRLDEAHKNGATKAFLHLDRLAQEGPQEAVEHALETAQRDSHPECAVIMHSPSPDLLRKAVENGIETVVVPPDRFDEAQRYLEREERRFMLSKLRDL
ncbi:MAG: hypothetical protein SVU32_05730, partial [Candidatus Nanohaloarchaea archaeon]|nr:hypothetical protein [Candidatus Nanohaloarchaea archaeon]